MDLTLSHDQPATTEVEEEPTPTPSSASATSLQTTYPITVHYVIPNVLFGPQAEVTAIPQLPQAELEPIILAKHLPEVQM